MRARPPRRFTRQLGAADLPRIEPGRLVTEDDLVALPAAARRFLRFAGVVGRSRVASFRLAMVGRFRTGPDRPWATCIAWQYNTRADIARLFDIRIRMAGVVPVWGHDTYVRGRGRMHVKLLDLFTVEDGQGTPYDIGELVTWLNDAVFLAPSMLLGPRVAFEAVDEDAFDLALTDHDHTVRARVYLNPDGSMRDFETTDRFYPDPDTGELVRTRWTTPMDGWRQVGDRWLPTRGRAIWHLPDGPFCYAELSPQPETLAIDVPPA